MLRRPGRPLVFLAIAFFGSLITSAASGQSNDQKVDIGTAVTALPYAIMSNDAYSPSVGNLSEAQVRRMRFDWEPVLWKMGYSMEATRNLRAAGFDAALYKNDTTNEITIAFRGSDQLKDFTGANAKARLGITDLQYQAAADLALGVKQRWPKGTPISLTGHSLGGALASYAGAKNPDIIKIYTFNAARNFLSTSGTNKSQINIFVRDDIVGSPTSSDKVSGVGRLPGKSLYVDSTTETLVRNPLVPNKIIPDVVSTHDIKGIVGGLEAIKTNSSVPPPSIARDNLANTFNDPLSTFRTNSAPAQKDTTPQSANAAPAKTSSGPFTRPPNIPTAGPTQPAAWPIGQAATTRPGGVSLSKAAAERMPLNITLDGSYYSEGRIVLTGKPGPPYSIDAALFLTSLRLACETTDPYFSLDPVDGTAWSKEGHEATSTFWNGIAANFTKRPNTRQKSSVFSIRTISAKRDYPHVWASMEANYPNLKSKLVFKPTWLEETRFGEILYKADVLLKELSGGIPLLEPGPARASKIEKYVSSDARFAAQGLLAGYEGRSDAQKPSWQGHRLWFDLTSYQPRSTTTFPGLVEPARMIEFVPSMVACRPNDRKCLQGPRKSELHRILDAGGLLPVNTPGTDTPLLASDGNAVDLSGVFPKMFVRKHDHVTRSDLSGNDPPLNNLAADVNIRIERYAAAYKELRALTDVFRAYVAAVHITGNDASLCKNLRAQPLFESEKITGRMPLYHQTELFITLASFEYSDGKYRRLVSNKGSSLNGGIAIRARAYIEEARKLGVATEITKIMNAEGVAQREGTSWKTGDNRYFVAFLIEPSLAETGGPKQASLSNSPAFRADVPIERYVPSGNQVMPQGRVPNQSDASTASPDRQRTAQLRIDPTRGRQENGTRGNGVPILWDWAGFLLLFCIPLIAIVRAWYRPVQTVGNVPNEKGSRASGAWAMPDQSRPTATHEDIEREFNLVFSDRSRTEKEQITASLRKIHGGAVQTTCSERWISGEEITYDLRRDRSK